uniref:Large ribosomal subunit protein bL35 n=1 Tax=candidate division WOR-3 bacterium TaxID=2052148 RepID=A0A7C4TBL5_UNCW3
MAKLKTKRGWKKRIKIRKSGKVSRRRAGLRHLLSSKSRKRKRRLSKPVSLSKADLSRIKGF